MNSKDNDQPQEPIQGENKKISRREVLGLLSILGLAGTGIYAFERFKGKLDTVLRGLDSKIRQSTNSILPTPQPINRESLVANEQWQMGEFTKIMGSKPYTPDAAVSVFTFQGQEYLITASADHTTLVTGGIVSNWENNEVVAKPSRKITEKGIAGYLGIASVVHLQDGSLLGFAHVEYHDPDKKDKDGITAGRPFCAQVELLQSSDGGHSWSKPILLTGGSSPDRVAWKTPNVFASGAGQPSAVIRGDQVILYFTDWNGSRADGICRAIAPLQDCHNPASWIVEVDSIAVDRPTIEDSYTAAPCVIFSKENQEFVMSFETAKGFYLCTSPDSLAWSAPIMIVNREIRQDLKYPSVLEVENELYFLCAAGAGQKQQHHPQIAKLQKK